MDEPHLSHVGVEYELSRGRKRKRPPPALEGQTFGSWTVLPTPPKQAKNFMWWVEVECRCGARRWIRVQRLTKVKDNNSCRSCYREMVRRKKEIVETCQKWTSWRSQRRQVSENKFRH